jgi:hypothetical protein
MYLNGDVDSIKSIQVLSGNGTVCISQDGYSNDGIDVSGLLPAVYVVAILQKDGKVYYEKVIKASSK